MTITSPPHHRVSSVYAFSTRMKHAFHWPAGILIETARRCGVAAFLWTIHNGDFTKLPPRLDYFELVRRPFCGFWIERLSNADGNSRANRIVESGFDLTSHRCLFFSTRRAIMYINKIHFQMYKKNNCFLYIYYIFAEIIIII